jgi:hypothetical protein
MPMSRLINSPAKGAAARRRNGSLTLRPLQDKAMKTFRTASVVLILCIPLLAGCNVWQTRAEFAAPESRWTADHASTVAADAPPPAIRRVHCYRTLGVVDCFTAKQDDRYTGYTGDYPTD